jgi:hypothetical protein
MREADFEEDESSGVKNLERETTRLRSARIEEGSKITMAER